MLRDNVTLVTTSDGVTAGRRVRFPCRRAHAPSRRPSRRLCLVSSTGFGPASSVNHTPIPVLRSPRPLNHRHGLRLQLSGGFAANAVACIHHALRSAISPTASISFRLMKRAISSTSRSECFAHAGYAEVLTVERMPSRDFTSFSRLTMPTSKRRSGQCASSMSCFRRTSLSHHGDVLGSSVRSRLQRRESTTLTSLGQIRLASPIALEMELRLAKSAQLPHSPCVMILRLLLVEDDEVDALAFTRSLSRLELPHQVIEARSASQALGILRASTTPLSELVVVTDLTLPGAGGLDLVRMLREDTTLQSCRWSCSRTRTALRTF